MIHLVALLAGLVGRLSLRLGRRGGTLVALAGLVSGLTGAWLVFGQHNLALGAVVLGAAPALLGIGLLVRLSPPGARRPASDAALRAMLAEGRALRLCLDCRSEVDAPRCPSCHKSSSCFDVRSDADRQNARALLGLSP